MRLRCAASAVTVLFVLLMAACAGLHDQEPDHHAARPAGSVLLGVYVPSGVWYDLAPLRALESKIGRAFDLAHWFSSWDDGFDPIPVENVLASDRIPLISWQPLRRDLTSIAVGDHDDEIRHWARGLAEADGVVYIRPFPEMNGDWVPWNGDPETFRTAWRRMAAVFAEEGAENVRWVFGPNVTDEPRIEANRMERYYPGHDVVDVLALSGYNWGAKRPTIGWRSFEWIFSQAYERLSALGPQDVWFAEVASTELGGDKAAWIQDMLDSTAFPRLRAVVWFNEDKETDWRIESSAASLEAFRAWFQASPPEMSLEMLAETTPEPPHARSGHTQDGALALLLYD